MSGNKEQLHSCLNLLESLGKKSGGYITYRAINEITAKVSIAMTMDAIDRIYQHLRLQQIEIVDHLPNGMMINTNSVLLQGKSQPKYYHRKGAGHRQKRRSAARAKKVTEPTLLCPEKGIDLLLLRFNKMNEITEDYFNDIVARCGFSGREVMDLIAYLGSLGINCPNKYEMIFVEDEFDGQLPSWSEIRALKIV